jgi:hypothetical protein
MSVFLDLRPELRFHLVVHQKSLNLDNKQQYLVVIIAYTGNNMIHIHTQIERKGHKHRTRVKTQLLKHLIKVSQPPVADIYQYKV